MSRAPYLIQPLPDVEVLDFSDLMLPYPHEPGGPVFDYPPPWWRQYQEAESRYEACEHELVDEVCSEVYGRTNFAGLEPFQWQGLGIRSLGPRFIVYGDSRTRLTVRRVIEGARLRQQLGKFFGRFGRAIALGATCVVFVDLFRHRARSGFCRGCRYDLRASPVRCPECGMPVSV